MGLNRESEIIERIKAGHAQDFEYLVRRYQRHLFCIVANLVHGVMVEDLVQDVFLAAFARIQSFDPRRGSFRTWLYRIARNHALNARKKKREEPLPPETPVLANERTPDCDLLVKEAFGRLDQALSELRFQDRVIFVLAELDGCSYAQIAQIEELALGTVKSRLARIKMKLRHALKPYMD